MKVWKPLKSLSEKDVVFVNSYTFKIGELLTKLNTSFFNAFSTNKLSLPEALNNEKLSSISDYSSWIDKILIKEDEPSLVEILNNPDLFSPEKISKTTDNSQKTRLYQKHRLISSGLSGEVLQVGEEWKPCKVVVKMYLEVYVEEEEPTTIFELPEQNPEVSPLDDIRQSLTNFSS
jgi:hypothetical protein